MRVEAALSSSGFPGSFFTNGGFPGTCLTDDSAHVRDGSPKSFTFGFLDAEKARKGSTEGSEEGPMDIRPYTLDSSEYSLHNLSFQPSAGGFKTSGLTAFHPPGVTSTVNKGNERPLTPVKVDSGSLPANHVSPTDRNSPKDTIFTRDKKRSWIQPPPEAYLQAPYNELRSRKDTPSLATQATDTSTNSYAQAVITFASKNPVTSATARTMLTNTVPLKRMTSPVDAIIPHEDRPSIDIDAGININTVKPTFVGTVSGPPGIKCPPQSVNNGRT